MRFFPTFSQKNFYQTKYTRLLGVLIFLLISSPFLEDSASGSVIISITFLSTLLLIINTFNLNKVTFWVYVLLAFLAFICEIIAQYHFIPSWSESLILINRIIDIIFISLAILVIGKRIFSDQKVGNDTIRGGICIYLLIGILWAFFYNLLFLLDGDSFSEAINLQETQSLNIFLYYSFTTLTTLGYGDIVPQNHKGMMFSNLEALIGQMYSAIILARLVGLYTAEEINKTDD
ncbi:ion channel family protein [Lyngbya aestuarii BL J]|uniref:Ion channel family protein n=1 Tax=Lyngbya aestuarii BL J TaxID=1348334 RepID=U7QFH4_9CYAN|nr:potassium channel family protein [Lyngbya aestuarii]ERT06653.1 ion channel family protein [Lyngbya aestuarii BL J]